MALLSLIFGGAKKAKIGVGSDLVDIDASTNETHERTSQLTQSEIEDGSKITDHVTLDPVKLTIEGLLTDSPLGLAQAGVGAAASFVSKRVGGELLGAAVAAGAGLVGGGVVKLLLGGSKSADISFAFFEELWKKREKVTVVTAVRKYENMIITSLSIPRNKEVGRGFRFTCTLQEIKIVKSESALSLFGKVAKSVEHTAGAAANIGKQATKATSTDTDSNLYNLGQGTGAIAQ